MTFATTVRALAIPACLAISFTAHAMAAPARADDLKATGVFPVTTETTLVIRGVPGQIVVITKPARELRFASRAKDASGSPRPLAVSFSGATVTMAPAAGATLGEGTLRVEAPAFFAVRVEAESGKVLVDGFAGAVAIVGKGTETRAQALTGTLDVNLEGGSLGLTNIGGAATVRIRASCTLTATSLRASLDLNSQDSTVKVQGLGGACRVEAHGGSMQFGGTTAGGEFHLSESPLRLNQGRGDVTVVSDAPVTFADMIGAMRLDLDGGTLRGQGNQGPVKVRARRTDVLISGISGELDLDVTRGKVAVQRVTGPVNAGVFAGDAQLLELQGPLRLDMDGGNAEVSWTALPADGDSDLKNHGGDIGVRFPGNASCRVSAKSSSGRITSDLPSVKTPPNATEAQGTIGQGKGPTVSIEADGNVRLSGGAAPPAPAS